MLCVRVYVAGCLTAPSLLCVRGPASNEPLSICAGRSRLLAPASEVALQMVATCPSVNTGLNKYLAVCVRVREREKQKGKRENM